MPDRTLTVKIVGDDDSLRRALGRSQKATQRFSVGIGTILKSAVGFTIIQEGFEAIGAGVRAATSEFSDAAKAAAQTNAVIASTGGVANVTAKQVNDLAESLQRQSGVDDELIKQGENLLLTFKNIRNEVGAGNAVFDRATQAALDLSVAGFGSIQSTSKQLGKALNDPVKGMTALGRAGVTFTQSQKDTIKAMVASNNLLGAQRLILEEVESQVGGSAKALGETLPGQLNKLRESAKNALGSVAESIVGFVSEPLRNALGDINDFVDRISAARGARARIAIAFEGVQDLARNLFEQIRSAIDAVDWPAAFEAIREGVFDAFRNIGQALGRVDWGEVGRAIGQFLADALRQTAAFLSSVDWGQVGRVIVRGIIDFLKNVDWGALLAGVFRLVLASVKGIASLLLGIGAEIGGQIMGGIGDAIDRVGRFVLEKLLAFVNKVLGVTGFLGRFDPFKGTRKKVQEQLKNMEADARTSAANIQSSINSIKGKKVTVEIQTMFTTLAQPKGALPEAGTHLFTGGADLSKTSKAEEEAAKRAEELAAARKARAERLAKAQAAVRAAAAKAAKVAAAAAEKAREAFESLMASLSLDLERAEVTASLQDDLRVLARQEQAIRNRIKAVGRTTDLLGQLFRVEQRQKEVREQIAQNRRDRQRARQFRTLGLTAEGEEPVPGVAALQRRLGQLRARLKAGDQLTPKIQAQLKKIGSVLALGAKNVGRDVRAAIDQMFDEIASGFDEGQQKAKKGFRVADVDDLIGGLGLSPDEVRRLRGRLSGIGAGGTVAPGGIGRAPVTAAGSGGIVITGPVTVVSNNPDEFQRQLQRKARRRGTQTTGPHAGNSMGTTR